MGRANPWLFGLPIYNAQSQCHIFSFKINEVFSLPFIRHPLACKQASATRIWMRLEGSERSWKSQETGCGWIGFLSLLSLISSRAFRSSPHPPAINVMHGRLRSQTQRELIFKTVILSVGSASYCNTYFREGMGVTSEQKSWGSSSCRLEVYITIIFSWYYRVWSYLGCSGRYATISAVIVSLGSTRRNDKTTLCFTF